ncbi:biotin holocarboxylase synthetase [Mitosporidium daphniae]|uniref:Biotin-acetyl-CoA-carboxylase ligase n=1 Tax=Mitosporidium daphniae TaxID=1485682 RepID=A0A098VPC7_9MICR|nr:biotin-acetyl-CoA-carboxylase ligase [Mitosporidium daphniae]KGG50887.1 biotin-acetyl-CoA-carboxylase ligase [Mitosporidium daphniae]|eukprot:XP_013237314.1 biotin-acetyl-CoA-carboxylase ligase [Mitosporidium daphniae]
MGHFSEELFASLLKKTQDDFGASIVSFQTIDSTQRFLEQNSHQYRSGTILVADHQTNGRGRGSNSWVSIPAALQFSFILKLPKQSQSQISLFQYYASLAMVEAISSFACAIRPFSISDPFSCIYDPSSICFKQIGIKWPNDIVFIDGDHSVKVGGVLVSSSSFGSEITLIIGIGVNLFACEGFRPSFGSLSLCGGLDLCSLSRKSLLAEFCFQFSSLTPRFLADFSSFSSHYSSRWMHSGKILSLEQDGFLVHTTGIDSTGMLTARKVLPVLGPIIFKASAYFCSNRPMFSWMPRLMINNILLPILLGFSKLIYTKDILLEPSLYSLDISKLRIHRKAL